MLTDTISTLKWGYRLVLVGVALALLAYMQWREGAPGSSGESDATDLQHALAGLKELSRAPQ